MRINVGFQRLCNQGQVLGDFYGGVIFIRTDIEFRYTVALVSLMINGYDDAFRRCGVNDPLNTPFDGANATL